MSHPVARLRAAWIVPISMPPIENGEIVIESGRILEARPVPPGCASDAQDLGDVILLPGLVNVHTHLDYTVMRGLLEDIEFFPWIRRLTAYKAALSPEDWVASATWGAAEALAGGVTTIADCTDTGAALFGACALGLRGIIYQEVFGIDESQAVETIIIELRTRVRQLQEAASPRLRIGISPHAPYTVRPALFACLARYAAQEALPLCIHAAESQAEGELLALGGGPIAEMFQRREIDWKPPECSTVAYLESFGLLGPQTLLVHGTQVSAADRLLAGDRQVAWAHCPKSNAKLGVGVAPLGILGLPRAGGRQTRPIPLRIGLGSDSVAGNNLMDLFEEMRFAVLIQRAARRRIDVLTARDAVEMATLGGAQALGLAAEIGSLEPGKRADLCVVRQGALHNAPAYDPYSALVYTARASDVERVYLDGELHYDLARGAGRFLNADLSQVRDRLERAAQKMRHAQTAAHG